MKTDPADPTDPIKHFTAVQCTAIHYIQSSAKKRTQGPPADWLGPFLACWVIQMKDQTDPKRTHRLILEKNEPDHYPTVHSNTEQYVATNGPNQTLYYTTVHCTTLGTPADWLGPLLEPKRTQQFTTLQYIQCSAKKRTHTVHYTTVHYNTPRCSAVRFTTVYSALHNTNWKGINLPVSHTWAPGHRRRPG